MLKLTIRRNSTVLMKIVQNGCAVDLQELVDYDRFKVLVGTSSGRKDLFSRGHVCL